jgi:hypothetical protein
MQKPSFSVQDIKWIITADASPHVVENNSVAHSVLRWGYRQQTIDTLLSVAVPTPVSNEVYQTYVY